MSTLKRAEAWHAQGGELRRRNRVPKRVGARAGGGGPGFTAAQDPNAWLALFPEDSRRPTVLSQSLYPNSPVGLLSGANWAAELTEYNSPSTTTATIPDGVSLEDKIIYGDLSPGARAANVEFSNCLFMGGSHAPSDNSAVLFLDSTTNSGSAAKWRMWDCEVSPQRPSLYRDGIRGNRWEAYRCVVRDCIDSYAPFSAGVNSGNANVKMMGCIGERSVYVNPDPEHSDGTHNDGCQVHGGKAIEVWGCLFNQTTWRHATATANPDKPWLTPPYFTETDTALGWANGAAIIITKDTGVIPDATVYFHHNWLRGGLATMNIKPGLAARIENNRTFSEGVGHQTSPTWNTYWTRYDAQTTAPNYAQITGLNPAGDTVVVNIGNVWANGPNAGQLLNTPQGAGINFNP